VGSGSGGPIVAGDHRNGSDRLFSRPKNSIMNIKMKAPVFDVIVVHGWMQFIKENTNCMTFWGNARIFERREYQVPVSIQERTAVVGTKHTLTVVNVTIQTNN
jgi:hypothetical protein